MLPHILLYPNKKDYFIISEYVLDKYYICIREDAMEKEKWTLKDKFEVAEAIFTIIVSLMAIWGTVAAWENGFWYKLKHITDHVHEEFLQDEKNGMRDVDTELKNFEQKIM